MLASRSETTDRFYNVGCGSGTTIRKLVELILEVTDSTLSIQYEPAGETFVTRRIGSTELAKRDLAFEAQVALLTLGAVAFVAGASARAGAF